MVLSPGTSERQVRHQLRRGFTIMESVISLFILTVVLSTLGAALKVRLRFQRETENRQLASILARNELEALRAAGPGGAAGYVGTRQVASDGSTDSGGAFTVTVSTAVLCEGGMAVDDNAQETSSISNTDCQASGRNPVMHYKLDVSFQGQSGERHIRYDLPVNERDRFGDARALN